MLLFLLCMLQTLFWVTAEPIFGGSPVGKIISDHGKWRVQNENKYPFVVHLSLTETDNVEGDASPKDQCGGVLIGSQTVLTAGHCIMDMKTKPKIEVTAGVVHLKLEKQKAYRRFVDKYLVHEHYAETCGSRGKQQHYCYNDIALLWLRRPFDFKSSVRPAILASRLSSANNKHGLIFGWGATEILKASPMLLVASQKVVPLVACVEEYKGTLFHNSKLCLKSQTKTSVFCYGDSGGPFTVDNVVYGIGSFGRKSKGNKVEGNCNPEKPSVYTNVSLYEDWIKTSIRKWSTKELEDFVKFEGRGPSKKGNKKDSKNHYRKM